MTYESFKELLLTTLREFFPADTKLSIHPFSHNNQLILDGLTIIEPGNNVSPTIYLNHYYRQYQESSDFVSIQQQILQYYHQHCPLQEIDTSFFTTFELAKPRIVYKLIHLKKNRELLQDIPYFPYLDLAIVFYCLVPEPPFENASILVYNHHLDYWGISKEVLLQYAEKNTPMLLPWRCSSLAELISPALQSFPPKEQKEALSLLDEPGVPMHILTNSQQYFGAACLLYPGALKEIARDFQDDLCILPSSIHEVILIPASLSAHPRELTQIVQTVNLTEVAQDEILSDSVYCYRQDTDTVVLTES